jgi:uncharacterized protein YggU (UPF0235/DUF167 family)
MRSTAAQPWRADPAGVRLLVRASPKSARQRVEGVVETAQGPALAVRVRAVAEKGEANRAVEITVAAWLGVPKSSVAVTAGGKSRLKSVVVTGEPARLAALVEMRAAELE